MKAIVGRVENCQGRQATPRYTLRLARTREEVEAALRLRFEVFNLELQEGFAESFFTGIGRGRIRSRLRTSHC
jgi:putative hemolysin